MIDSIPSSLSSLSAYGKVLAVTADNLANYATPGFKKSRAVLREGDDGGVSVELSKSAAPQDQAPAIDPQAAPVSAAALSNVDPAEELPRLAAAHRGIEADLKTLKTRDEMLGTLLDVFV